MRRGRVAVAALAVAQVAFGLRQGRVHARDRSAGSTRAIVGLMAAAAAVEAVDARGERGPAPLAAAGAVGFAAEVVGVATGRPFGRYSYSDRLGPRVAGVPLLAAAAWAALARAAWVTAGWVSARPGVRVPVAAGALTAWDVYVDPRMAGDGYWTWPGGGRYEGVPASNFAGWLATGLVTFGCVAALDASPPGARDDGALALYAWTWIGEGLANALLWRRPLTGAAGAAAMGAFAAPALWRRWRCASR